MKLSENHSEKYQHKKKRVRVGKSMEKKRNIFFYNILLLLKIFIFKMFTISAKYKTNVLEGILTVPIFDKVRFFNLIFAKQT